MDFGGKLANGQLCFAEDAKGVRSAKANDKDDDMIVTTIMMVTTTMMP